MRLTLLAIGSRGDVQPMAALGRGLLRAGHKVRLATFVNYRFLAESAGIEFAQIKGGCHEVLESDEGRAMIESGGNIVRQIRAVRAISRKLISVPGYWASYHDACRNADAIIYRDCTPQGFHLAQKFGIPGIIAATTPALVPTGAFASPLWPVDPGLGPAFNRLTHSICLQIMWQPFRGMINDWRRDHLGLKPFPLRGPYRDIFRGPVLYAFSPAVVPRSSDWTENVHVTGYWFLPAADDWAPHPALVDFLRAGPPPVYIGFGSAAGSDVTADVQLAKDALRRSGCRGLLSIHSQGSPEALSDDVMLIGNVPHDWLFPRMAAIVHHGGAGSTAAGLRAGVPNILIPFCSDQPFWGRRVAAVNAGPKALPHKQVTSAHLAGVIKTAVIDKNIRRSAAAIGERIRSENGVEAGVDIINHYLGVGRPTPATRMTSA